MKLSFNTIHPCKVAYAVLLQLAEKAGGFDYIRGREIGEALENEDLTSAEVIVACRAAAAFWSAKRFPGQTGKYEDLSRGQIMVFQGLTWETSYGWSTLLNQILLGLKGEYDQPPRRWGHPHYSGE